MCYADPMGLADEEAMERMRMLLDSAIYDMTLPNVGVTTLQPLVAGPSGGDTTRGDYSPGGQVDAADYQVWKSAFGSQSEASPAGTAIGSFQIESG